MLPFKRSVYIHIEALFIIAQEVMVDRRKTDRFGAWLGRVRLQINKRLSEQPDSEKDGRL